MSIRLRRSAAVFALIGLAVVLVATHSVHSHQPLHSSGVSGRVTLSGVPRPSPSPLIEIQVPTPGPGIDWKLWGLLAIAVAVLALLGWAVWARLRNPRRRPGLQAVLGATIESSPETVAGHVSAALDDAALSLRQGRSDEAIIACWLRLEHLAHQAGVGRSASRTSTELARRLIETTGVDARRLNHLESLYREARFSDHRMSDADRVAAADDLTELSRHVRRQSETPPDGTPPNKAPPNEPRAGPMSPARR